MSAKRVMRMVFEVASIPFIPLEAPWALMGTTGSCQMLMHKRAALVATPAEAPTIRLSRAIVFSPGAVMRSPH
jgi:hypothetical protein